MYNKMNNKQYNIHTNIQQSQDKKSIEHASANCRMKILHDIRVTAVIKHTQIKILKATITFKIKGE